jgi:hypothetical protein
VGAPRDARPHRYRWLSSQEDRDTGSKLNVLKSSNYLVCKVSKFKFVYFQEKENQLMTRLSKLATALAVVPVFAISASALADSPGQLAGGPNVYTVKNLTQKGSYSTSVSAACNDELQYSVELHNPFNGGLTNVVVKATVIPSP